MTRHGQATPSVSGERGVALIAAILMMVVMSALALALTTSGRIEVAMGDNEEMYAQTRAAAESGLNHAAAIIIQQASNPTFPVNSLLQGPDGQLSTSNMSAAVNADNGVISHLIGGTAPWPVVAGSAFSYDVRLLDDDDPELKNGVAFTNVELTAMGAGRPAEVEDGNRFSDVNKRLVIRATGFGPQGITARLEQMLTPIPMPALLVNGDLTMAGNAQVIGTQGSVHASGNLMVDGTAVTITQNATASGTLTANANWDPGGVESGGMPTIPVPDIRAIDYFNEADFVLQADGRITNRAETTVYCNAGSNQNACRNITPPGGTAAFGWTFNAGAWDLSQNSANSATYYARTDVRITGNPGTNAAPILLTIIAEGDIEITGNPDLRPEPASVLQFVTDQDLRIAGNLGIPLAFEGRILVREQIDFAGNPTLAGQVIVQNVPSVSTLVTNNTVTGSVTLSYNGLIETVAYTVSGWRETQ
jgi:hypothetical protein